MQPEMKQSVSKPSSKAKSAVVAALALTACLAGVAQYHRVQVSEEINDGTRVFPAFGYAGYEFVNQPKTFDEAKDYCSGKGMVLATVDEQWKLNKVRQVSANQRIWIGYHAKCSLTDPKCYRWESGAPTDWAVWGAGEPNNLAGEVCVELDAAGHFNNLVCNVRLPFVCDKSPYFEGYAIHGVNGAGLTFDEANEYCRVRYLTSLATIGDADLMENVIQHSPANTAWTGLRLIPGTTHNVKNFQFISGEPIRHPLRWAPGEPNSLHERCVEIRRNGELNDILCQHRSKWFICDQFAGGTANRWSSFEITSERRPVKNAVLPAKFIYFDGRRRYNWKFEMVMTKPHPNWASIVHVGNEDAVRIPALWQTSNNERRLHFRQSSEGHSNEGCDPTAAQTPAFGQWFKVEVISEPGLFRVLYNNKIMCQRSVTLYRVHDHQKIWISDPWWDPAPVILNQMLFKVY